MFIPEKSDTVEMVTGETPEESGANLANKVINISKK